MRKNQQELRETLIRQIDDAFADVTLTSITLFDDPAWQLQGKHWHATPIEMLKQDGFIFTLPMHRDGQFFLAAFMVALLAYPNEMVDYVDSMLLVLQWAAEPWDRYQSTPFAYLNQQQKATVLAYLEAYPHLYTEKFILKSYPPDVINSIKRMLPTDVEPPPTTYELWKKAITFWRGEMKTDGLQT